MFFENVSRGLPVAVSVAKRTGRVAINSTSFYSMNVVVWPIYVFNPLLFVTPHGQLIGDWVILKMLLRGVGALRKELTA